MFNKDFLKKLTILFVEDEEIARKQLEKVLTRLFDNVITASNGQEAYEIYQEKRLLGKSIDLILSDINMPIMNGIEMLEKIRIHDKDTPVIFATARTESTNLIKAIHLGVDYYALKPIDMEDVIKKIEKVCEKKYYEKLIHEKVLESQEYLKIINNVATIYKMDEDKNIIFANSLFLESLGFVKNEDLIGKNFEDIINHDVNNEILKELWNNVESGKVWHDDIKYKDINGKDLYIKSTIFNISAENKKEYINIGFNSTLDVNKKREFHKQIIFNIKEKNIELNQSLKDIKKYEEVVELLQNELKMERDLKKNLNNQIRYYENEIVNVDQKVLKHLKVKNHEIEDLKNNITKIKHEKQLSLKNIEDQKNELISSKIEISKLYDTLKNKEKRIEDLLDLVEIRESQLRKYDESFEK